MPSKDLGQYKEYKRQYRIKHANETREYARRWYELNRDRILKHLKQYRKQHYEQTREYKRQWYKQHSDRVIKKVKQYREQHLDEIRKKDRRRSEQHREEKYKYVRQWYKLNRDRILKSDRYIKKLIAESARRRGIMLSAKQVPHELTDVWRQQLMLQRQSKSLREVLNGSGRTGTGATATSECV